MASPVPDLPLWAWNLIIAVQGHEERHASSDRCLKGILAAVPPEVRSQAEAIAAYVQQARGDDLADKAADTWADLMVGFFPHADEAKAAP
ncbi:hypothetical protein ACFYO9_33990 [Streptomyces sp. NPDC005863]|uniref:hypothetical protein n=1 Tax=Streptomyces sp. NPDC005863 TaxID=3364735 RepID=UPI00367FC574